MKRKSIYVLSALLIAAFVTLKLYRHFSGPEVDYLDPEVIAYHFNGNGYVGSTTCMECHQQVYESHILTPHFNTSAYATLDKVKASFEEGENTLSLLDANLLMTIKNGTPFQHAKLKYGDHREFDWSMDIIIGSGSKGQSYLSQQPDGLYQLQASYYVPSNSWINSPNYTNRLNPLRAVNDQCLKCHVTFAKNLGPTDVSNKYDITKMVMGIDCERCHGPGQQHVVNKRNHPQLRDTSMVQMASLSRQQRLDLCASCHSGLRNNQIKNPFKFLPGDTLSNFSKNYHSLRPNSKLDVHGNQYGLLTSSKCFTESTSLDCITCHDPHKNQRGDHAYFNAKCMQCHSKTTVECSIPDNNMGKKNNNCIQCHMPVIPSQAMQVQLSKEENTVPVGVRTHYIAIYKEESEPPKNKE
ncbi:hypothetical protein J8L85_05420 [Maribacter sp. MMG018]|uniref:multiheme c-type cytochrome n=1 Tax=Maribacter sp. MMG018 TaxID=2822688 RepID=UPI001B39ACFF|nr:multiheme c-type cytochrome [Maribacter sp. MMG018]MBQ4913866.1 hypothetical protein [Maribacter sp. MMG018]